MVLCIPNGLTNMKACRDDIHSRAEKFGARISLPNAGLGARFPALMADLAGPVFDSTLLKEHATQEDPYAVAWSAENPNYGFGPYEG
ncbi:hypothetical protein [Nocardia jinanensis]|uniref:Uncharacterized protein n=1 Tax=Nocardia jinanensis TaxID=382504 RepID=A0A917RXW7_9NOCA|nr:hypothetical protein [Nocardia jinanensis]GGL43002.1 hypothetical protein GCM10011588_67220 [Nocardia jinanensis]